MTSSKLSKERFDAVVTYLHAAIGVKRKTVSQVLDDLLKVYDYNWEFIEADDFRVLTDAIFDEPDPKEGQKCQSKGRKDRNSNLDSDHRNKKLKVKHESQDLPIFEAPLAGVRPPVQDSSHQRAVETGGASRNRDSDQRNKKLKVKQESQDHPVFEAPLAGVRPLVQDSSHQRANKDARMISGAEHAVKGVSVAHERTMVDTRKSQAITNRKDSLTSFEDAHMTSGVQRAVEANKDARMISGAEHAVKGVSVAHERTMADTRKSRAITNRKDSLTSFEDAHMTSGVQRAVEGVSLAHERTMADTRKSQAITNRKDSSTNFDVALSHSGTGKLSFTYNSASPDFNMPDMELVCKEMEARYLRTSKFLEPNFSFMKLLQDVCQCIIDIGCESSGPREKEMIQIIPAVDFLSKPLVPRVLQSNQAGFSIMSPNSRIVHGGICSSSAIAEEQNISSSMQVIAKRLAHDVNDISKGEENVTIPIINEHGNGILPPPFQYIPFNITFQNAHVSFSLARIGDENCCSECFGDCLEEPIPCACASETGGNFAYTRDGLLTEVFLDSCISMLREPHKHPVVYCKICPNELVKIKVNSDSLNTKVNPDPCKGHQITKFIKECWSKCGCNRNCGNRVVQRGITRHLQVFLTNGKKGWGLRAAEELPRGAFICEYVGEILTNNELYERNVQMAANEKHTYPVNLDGDWATEGVLEDDNSLSLDATFYGNVARFINHRCFDANLVGIPVEIETPDHHYYHLAFFTTRQTKPFEELTWDYRIHFDDMSHPIKAFKCLCGSEYCRGKGKKKHLKI